jgi:predicted alpha/beta superfamily hydrolase
MRFIGCCVVVTAICLFSGIKNVSGQTNQTDICIAGTAKYNFISKINSVSYQISVALPFNYSPSDSLGYPVMYLLDGDPNLPMAALIQRNMSYDHEVPDIIMVGIGYPVDNFLATRSFRIFDFTPTDNPKIDSEMTASHHMKMTTGGAPEFLKVLEKEIIPLIERNYQTNHDRALAGHSLGGVFALYALFHKPALFQKYLISSPSLYWNDFEMAGEEADFYASNPTGMQARIFITTGSLEPDPMMPDMKQFVKTLRLRQYKDLEITESVFQDETHLSVMPFAISKGLRAIYKQKNEK